MKKNLSLIKFNSEKNSTRKLRKCEMELAAILLQLCAIFGHTRHSIFIWGKSRILFFKLNFLSEEFICWIWKDIFLCQSFTGLYLTEIIWIISVLSRSKKKCWGRFRVGFSCQTFFLFFPNLWLWLLKKIL